MGQGEGLAERDTIGGVSWTPVPAAAARSTVRGKFFFLGGEKLYLRGVTYGTFRPGNRGVAYPDSATVERDFSRMAAAGVNAVRTYTVPPRSLLDCAHRHGLLVMVGLAWEQHVAFLDHDGRSREIEQRVREGVRSCAGHRAILAYVIGNEIPAPVVRWHGRQRVESFLRRLYSAAKEEDSDALVTYVNYPPTEYLDLSFVDFLCFNVYLEAEERLEAYLARLNNIAGDRPVVMAEIGLDSRRHGQWTQAQTLRWQVETAFRGGCAGAFVFAWTDEWYVTYLSENGQGQGGSEIHDWDFGLTDRERRAKPSLATVRRAFAEAPFPRHRPWPRFSVIVCTHNGQRTLRDCLEGLAALDYPDFEVIVVDDGSTDGTAAIAGEYEVRLIRTANRGLSSARNTGMKAADGELIAYLDDDACPDQHWLKYLAVAFGRDGHVGIGGPNIAPDGDGSIAECVANAPGGPTHVLLSDDEAEHIPGCNAAFRKQALEAIGGFDPRFRVAGDDVDVCWRLRDRGWTLGFSPAAVVWHHRRSSVRAYLRQQRAYGRAEALLERKWPERYDAGGHLTWRGRLYNDGFSGLRRRRRERIYRGTWGSALFQSVYQPAPGLIGSLPSMPEWYLVIGALAGLSALGVLWWPLLAALLLLVPSIAVLVARAVSSAASASFQHPSRSRLARLKLRGLTALLFLLQPLARLRGRVGEGLTPWRRRGTSGISLPLPRTRVSWSERTSTAEQRLETIEAALRERGAVVMRGSEYDDWDLEVRSGGLGAARLRTLIEEHGAGRQLVRFRVYPKVPLVAAGAAALLSLLVIGAAAGGVWPAAIVLGAADATLLVMPVLLGCATALSVLLGAVERPRAGPERHTAASRSPEEVRT